MEKCAFEKPHHCSALREKMCEGCSFRKSNEELNEGRRKAIDRINSLPTPKKSRIIRTYHKQWRS
jgi:hypothetical protein